MYDFYRDSNVPEAIRLNAVIQPLLYKVNGFLEEWPDHPTLLSVSTGHMFTTLTLNVLWFSKHIITSRLDLNELLIIIVVLKDHLIGCLLC